MNQLDKQRIADLPTGVFQDLEEELMANIIRHCKDYGQPIATDEWLLKKLAEIGKLNRENIRIIARSTGLSQTAIERMLTEVAEKVLDEVDPALRQVSMAGLAGEAVAAEKSQNVQRVSTAMRRQAKDVMNLCNTVMLYKARDAYKAFVQNMASTADEIAEKQGFLDALNKHAASVVIGSESRQQALRKCIREFNEKGIPAFVDRRGREWTPEAYINMAMRSTSNTMAAEIQMARADDYGIDLVEVDSHSGARPKCARDQGKIFDRKNKSDKYPHWSSSSYGQPDGLLGINCRHHIWPYIEGVSVRRYFPTEDLEENDRLYKATQVQRAMERDVRKQKRECMLYDQIGDRDGFEAAAVKLKAKEAKLRSYVNQNPDLRRRRDREQVVGFDKGVSAKSRGTAEKHYQEWAKSIGASKKNAGPEKLADYYRMKYNDSKESRLYKGYTKAVNRGNISPLVGFDVFRKTAEDAEKRFVGMHTADGAEIKGVTAHFVDRVIGQQSSDSPARSRVRNGVAFADIEDALRNPRKIDPVIEQDNGKKSKLYRGKNAAVSYNPDTGELIQVQPKRKK